ncbi:MAG: Spy/CpxP family protein refolding chaperone [Phycisphaerales bacterium]
MRTKMQEFRKYRAESEKQFFTDVKGVLNKDQVSNWSAFERTHKREQSMGRGMMSGERADVVALVEQMKLSDDKMKTLDPVLAAYENEIDKPIDRRNEIQDKFMNDVDMGSLFRGDGDDATRKKAEDLMKEGREAATAIRDINRKYAKQIENTLGGEEGAKFAESFHKASFPQVYGGNRYVDRAFTSALDLKDLQPNQVEGIKALQEKYKRDVRPIDEAAEKAQEEREASFSITNMQNFGRGQNDEKAQEARRQRRELEDDAVTKLKAILTPEQAGKLPERGGPNGGGGQGGDGQGGRRARNGGGGQGGNDGNNSGNPAPRRQRNGNNNGGGAAPKDANPPAPKN